MNDQNAARNSQLSSKQLSCVNTAGKLQEISNTNGNARELALTRWADCVARMEETISADKLEETSWTP
jgi:hypothetical protein